ncbi:MAG TPA: helicase-related protein, partial [Pseudomonadales bacterium]|nr:helicase-related protein [Pseudomonadales bacterium]
LTATPYRLDSGYLYQGDGSLFDKVSYEIPVQRLIDEGHLCEVVAKAGRQVADMSGVKKRMGEFNQTDMARAFEQDGLLVNACQQIIEEGADRRAWIVFCASVDQAEQVTEIMRASGVNADLVTGAHSKGDREKTIERFKSGQLKCLVNVDVLTIGFNAPICDLAALIRATDSTAMYVQIVGRIMRTYPNKQNALLLDFGGNVERHGPIDDVAVKTPGKGDGEAPAKTCPECLMIVEAGVRNCPECGHEFPPPEPKIEKRAFSGAVLKAQRVPDRLAVMFVKYNLHSKPGKPMSVRVTYTTGKKQVNEWLLPEHGGMATSKTAHAIMQRYNEKCPPTSVELLALLKQQKKPSFITVEKDGKYERVIKVEFENE